MSKAIVATRGAAELTFGGGCRVTVKLVVTYKGSVS